MDLEISFEFKFHNNFCESSFVIAKTLRRRTIPSIKRLDLQLSRIKTTLNRKSTIKKNKFLLNVESSQINSSISSMVQFPNSNQKSTTYIKNLKKKSGCTNINVNILI